MKRVPYWIVALLTSVFILSVAVSVHAQTPPITTHQGGTGVSDVAPGSILFGSVRNIRLATSSALQFNTAAANLAVTYASTTGASATFICISTDCRSSWPTGSTYTATYPVQITGSVISLAFGTTTNNVWSGTNNFTTVPTLGTLSGVIYGNSGTLNTAATSTPTVTAPITYSGTLGSFIGGSSGTFACTSASSGVTGCLTGTDWATFNNKISSSSLSATFPLAYNSTTGIFSTSFSTTTTWGLGNNGFVVTGATGIPFATASSSLSLPNTALQNSSITINGSSVSLGGSITVSSTTLLANSNTFGGTQTFTNAPIFSSLTGILKGNGASALTVAANGTDYSLITALTCGAGQHFSAVTASGTFTCSADTGGGFPFTPDSYNSVANNSTTTALWIKAPTNSYGIIASSSYFTYASSTVETVSTFFYIGAHRLLDDALGGIAFQATPGTTVFSVDPTYIDAKVNLINVGSNSGVGRLGWGTSTPAWGVQLASSTGPQIALSDSSLTSNHWTMRSINSNFYIATASPSTYATSTVSALSINTNGVVNFAIPPTRTGGTNSGTGGFVFVTSPTLATPTFTTSFTSPIHIGGSAVSSTLILRSTSGVGTSDAIIFQTGNSIETARFNTKGNFGIGTTTPSGFAKVTISTSSPQLLLTDGTAASIPWNIRSFGGSLFFATSSPSTFATSSISAISVDTNGALTVNNLGTGIIMAILGKLQQLILSASFTLTGSTLTSNHWQSFTYATSTAWTGTTTVPLEVGYGETINNVRCFTDVGTVDADFYTGNFTSGNKHLNYLRQASTTIGTTTMSTNNLFQHGTTTSVNLGTPASSPTKVTCTVSKTL